MEIPASEMVNRLKTLVEPFARAFDLKLIVLFGSAARGKLRSESDIDIGIVTESPLFEDPGLYRDFMAALEPIENDLRRTIDCVQINSHNILLLKQILREGVLLHESSPQSYRIQRLHWRFLVEDNKKYAMNYEKVLERKLEAL
jgi:predicted nucleotidyltransferase